MPALPAPLTRPATGVPGWAVSAGWVAAAAAAAIGAPGAGPLWGGHAEAGRPPVQKAPKPRPAMMERVRSGLKSKGGGSLSRALRASRSGTAKVRSSGCSGKAPASRSQAGRPGPGDWIRRGSFPERPEHGPEGPHDSGRNQAAGLSRDPRDGPALVAPAQHRGYSGGVATRLPGTCEDPTQGSLCRPGLTEVAPSLPKVGRGSGWPGPGPAPRAQGK